MRGLLALVGAVGALLAASPAAAAAVDYFLQIDGIHGPSTQIPSAIELTSFQWGAGRGVSAPTGAASDREGSAPSVSEIVITKTTDSTSPLLMRACANGQHFPTVVLYVRKSGGQAFVQYRLTDVLVSSDRPGGGADRPTESLTLHFATIQIEDSNGAATSVAVTPATTGVSSNPWAH